MTETGKPLEQSDVIGKRITAVYQTYQLRDEWLDECATYFHLDSGMCIWLGSTLICKSELPKEAKELIPSDPEVRAQLIGQEIEGIYVEEANEQELGESKVCLKLENGRFVFTELMAPHGTGGAGMWVNEPDEPPFELMKRYSLN